MEASSAHAQSDKKRPKVSLDTKIFATAVKAVQVQTTPSPSVDSVRKKPPRVAAGDSFNRPTQSKSETDVVLSTASCSVDETGKSPSDNRLETAEIPCGRESKDPRGKAESCCGSIMIDPVVKKEGNCDVVDSRGEKVETVRGQSKGESTLVQSDSVLDKVVNLIDQDRVKGQTIQVINSSICEKPTALENTESSRSVDQEYVDRKKHDDHSRKPGSVRSVHSADRVPYTEHEQMLNRAEVGPQNKNSRSSDRGNKQRRARGRRSSDSGRVEQQNKDCRSPDHGKRMQNDRGRNWSSDHVKKEWQTKARALDTEKSEQQLKDHRSWDRKKVELPSKAPQSSDHEKVEQPNKDHRSSDHEKVKPPNKDQRSLGREKVDWPSKAPQTSDREKVEQPNKDHRSSAHEKVEQPSKAPRSSDREKVEQQNKDHRSSDGEKVEQPSKARSSDREKVEQQNKDHQSSDDEKVEQPSIAPRLSDCEKVEQPSKAPRSSDRENIEQSCEDQSLDHGKIQQPSKDHQSSDREKIDHQANDQQSSCRRKSEPQNRDCRPRRGEAVRADRCERRYLRYPGSYNRADREDPQQCEFRSHRGAEEQGRDKRIYHRHYLYHHSKIPRDSTSQNTDYQQNNAEKPHKFEKERLGKNGSLQREDKALVASSDDVTELKGHSKTRNQFGTTSASRGGRKSRRGTGALGMGYNCHLGSSESVKTERSNEAENEKSTADGKGRGNSAIKPLLDYNWHLGSRESMKTERSNESEIEKSTAGCRGSGSSTIKPLLSDYSRHLGSRESVKTDRSNDAEIKKSTADCRGRGNSAIKPSLPDHRHRPEHKSSRRTGDYNTDKDSDYHRVDFPDNFQRARTNRSERSDAAEGVLVYNRGHRGKYSRSIGYSTRDVEHFGNQNRRVSYYNNDSRWNSTSIDENRRTVESPRNMAHGRVARCAPGKSATLMTAPEKSSGFSTHSSKQDPCNDRMKDKEVYSIYNSRHQSKDDEKSKSHPSRPVAAEGGEDKPGTKVKEARGHGNRMQVSTTSDAVVFSADGGSFTKGHHSNTLHINHMEFTNTLLRDGCSSHADSGNDVDSLCSIFSVSGSLTVAPSSVSPVTMDVSPSLILAAPGACVTNVPPLTDGRVTPVYGGFQARQVPHLNSQGFATRNSADLMNVRDFPPLHHPHHHPRHEGSLEKSFDPWIREPFGQYPDGSVPLSHGLFSPPCSSPPYWSNQPPAGPQFGTPPNTMGLRHPVRHSWGMLPSGSSCHAGHGCGSGRFVHTSPARPYKPPEPLSPAPDPRSLIQAAFQGGSSQLENRQVTPMSYSSPFQLPVPSPTAPVENWNQVTATPVSGTVTAPQAVPQLTPSLNISRKAYQHWMECYIKARDTRDEASINWCRHYWYVAVFLPSHQPQADAGKGPAVGRSDPLQSPDVGVGSDLPQVEIPFGNSGQQMSCSKWPPLDQEASADPAESSTPLGCSDRKPCDGSKDEPCPSDDRPRLAFRGISGKTCKGSSGGGEERMRMKCKRLSYGDLDASDATARVDGSPAKVVKMFKVERATDQESFHNSQQPLSFNMKPQRFQRFSENQFFRTQGRGKSVESRGEESDRPKFQVTRRSFSSMSQAVASPVNFIVSEWMDWKAQFKQLTENATVPYIDSHCHLDLLYRRAGFQGTFKDFRSLQAETFPSNFLGCVAIFCNPLSWSSYLLEDSLFKSLLSEENIWAAVGCHPKSAVDFNARTEMNLRQLLKHDRVKALGEIGLDYSGNYAQHRDVQLDVLQRQVTTALKLNKPLVIHARDAESEISQVLEKLVPKHYKIHRHCFLGSWSEAEAWLEKFPNSYIGLTPAVTHSKYHSHLRDLMWHLPLDKLLLETDTPYFIPAQIPNSEMSMSHPGLAITVAVEVANIKQIPVNDVLSACLRNTREMYNL